MVLYLHSEHPPTGRPAMLAHALYNVTGDKESLRIAGRMFFFENSRGNPAKIIVTNPSAVEALKAICSEFGIVVEVRDQ